MRTLLLAAVVLAAFAAPATAQFMTGFEPPDYTAGGLTGQQSWTVNPASTNYRVTNDPVYVISGTQSYMVSGNAGRAASHSIGAGLGDIVTVDVLMAKATVNTAQWWLALQKADGSGRSLGFGFESGNIRYYSGGGWQTYQTGYNAAQAYHFVAELNWPAQTWSLTVDGNLVGAALPLWNASAQYPETVYLYRGYLDITGLPSYANYAVADNLKVVPEPASLLALAAGLAGFAGALRRR